MSTAASIGRLRRPGDRLGRGQNFITGTVRQGDHEIEALAILGCRFGIGHQAG